MKSYHDHELKLLYQRVEWLRWRIRLSNWLTAVYAAIVLIGTVMMFAFK